MLPTQCRTLAIRSCSMARTRGHWLANAYLLQHLLHIRPQRHQPQALLHQWLMQHFTFSKTPLVRYQAHQRSRRLQSLVGPCRCRDRRFDLPLSQKRFLLLAQKRHRICECSSGVHGFQTPHTAILQALTHSVIIEAILPTEFLWSIMGQVDLFGLRKDIESNAHVEQSL